MLPDSKANHYEKAFESYLRTRSLTYIATSEHRRTISLEDDNGPRTIKTPDFIITTPDREKVIVDVKGKQLPYLERKNPNAWENWLKGEDLEALAFWENAFGRDFTGLIVFAYWIREGKYEEFFPLAFTFDGRIYGLMALSQAEYTEHARRRSAKWDTFSIPVRTFRRVVRPLSDFI